MHELTIANQYDIQVQGQEIVLLEYDELKRQIDEIGEYLTSIEVTEDNIKESKRLVAQVRKACDELNHERIEFKKSYLKPLETLERQVKELSEIAKSYEDTVRVQIRALEEEQRDQKRTAIHNIFVKRLRAYGSEELYPFEEFLKPTYLNKSTTLKKIEEEMADWLEARKNDLDALVIYSDTIPQSKEEVIAQYIKSNDLSTTMKYFTELNTTKAQVARAVEKQPKRANRAEVVAHKLIQIKESDLEKVEQLLSISGIEYEVIK